MTFAVGPPAERTRPLLERVLARAPRLASPWLTLLFALPVRSRLRRRCLRFVVRRSMAAVNRRDLDAIVPLLEPDMTLHAVGFGVGTSELMHGPAGLHAFFAEWEEAMGWPQFNVERIIDLGDRVLLRGSLIASGRLSGVETVNRNAAAVFWPSRRGRLRELQFHWEWREALVAAGVSSLADLNSV